MRISSILLLSISVTTLLQSELLNKFPDLIEDTERMERDKYRKNKNTILSKSDILKSSKSFLRSLSQESYGNGDKEIFIFSSENCKYCKILNRTLKDGGIKLGYKYYIIEKREINIENFDEQREIYSMKVKYGVKYYPTILSGDLKTLMGTKEIVDTSIYNINNY